MGHILSKDDDDWVNIYNIHSGILVLALAVVFLVLRAIMSYFTYYVFYVCLFWALVSGRLTLCVP